MIAIKVNGEPRELPGPATLAQFLETVALARIGSGLAVCVNGEVVRRAEWGRTTLKADDELEIVQATQGG
ncbi:MAG: sulfur carrier protein ThiS [Candidatus Lambdaproteobacteria bacterium]|nr:sulfur carrier protein ThiS [Candidatus Lambdaproteobacteria bacterium]